MIILTQNIRYVKYHQIQNLELLKKILFASLTKNKVQHHLKVRVWTVLLMVKINLRLKLKTKVQILKKDQNVQNLKKNTNPMTTTKETSRHRYSPDQQHPLPRIRNLKIQKATQIIKARKILKARFQALIIQMKAFPKRSKIRIQKVQRLIKLMRRFTVKRKKNKNEAQQDTIKKNLNRSKNKNDTQQDTNKENLSKSENKNEAQQDTNKENLSKSENKNDAQQDTNKENLSKSENKNEAQQDTNKENLSKSENKNDAQQDTNKENLSKSENKNEAQQDTKKENVNKSKNKNDAQQQNTKKENLSKSKNKNEAQQDTNKENVNKSKNKNAAQQQDSNKDNLNKSKNNVKQYKGSKNKGPNNKKNMSQLESENEDQANHNKQVEETSQTTSSEKVTEKEQMEPVHKTRPIILTDAITVYFHVIVLKDFCLNTDKDEVIVRAGGMREYRAWRDVVCHMHFTRSLEEHGWLYEGHTEISKDYQDISIPYKYVVVRNKEHDDYEFIYKTDGPEEGIVNRCLHIQSKFINGRDWHQYDDIMCINQNNNFFTKIKQWVKKNVSRNDILKGKMTAGSIMLDSIFSLLTPCDSVNLSNFFSQLHQFYIVSSQQLLFQNVPFVSKSHGFGQPQVHDLILDMMKKICQPFLETNSSSVDAIIKKRLAAGLVCVILAEKYPLLITKDHLGKICSVLCPEKKHTEVLIDEINNIKTFFAEIKGMDVYLKLLCKRCIDEDVNHWLWVLPLLHAFSALSHSDNSSKVEKLKQEDEWAALEGLPYDSLINTPITYKRNEILQFMSSKKYLLQIDKLLIRSWLCLVPLEHMCTLLEQNTTGSLNVITASCYKFPKVSYSENEKAEDILKKILRMIQDLKERPTEYVQLCNASLHLHNTVCTNKNIRTYHNLPILSAEIVLLLLGLSCSQESSNAMESEMPNLDNILDNAIRLTKEWFRDISQQRFKLGYWHSYPKELQVWSSIIEAGKNVSPKWKESFLSDLLNKIKQEDPITQIKIYCENQTQFRNLHESIGKCFEDCAVEAVHLASQAKSNILSQLSKYNLGDFGRLVSTVINNSWPKDGHGNAVKEHDIILQHLLQWNGATHIFKLYGMDKNIISEFDEGSQELVALSDSLFLEVRNKLMSGDVLYKHLECIVENKTQFLAICKLKIEKHENLCMSDVEEVLKWRTEELESLKRERQLMDSLLKMCQTVDEIIRVNISKIQKKHSEKMEPKQLSELLSVKILGSSELQPDHDMSFFKLSPSLMSMAKDLHNYRNSHIFNICWKMKAQNLAEKDDEEYDEESEDYVDNELSLEEMKEELFTPCFEMYKKIYEDIKSGTVTFDVVDNILVDFKNRYKELHEECKVMCHLRPVDNGQWIKNRVEQIEQYHQLGVAFDSAEVIKDLKKSFNLNGDFKTLETLLQFADNFNEQKQKNLSCINLEFMKTKQILSELTEEHINCLRQIVVNMDFINWVKEALEDVNELKVFVDLASISAGENDMDVDRVACFHDAVLGYSSLLYDLKPEFGFEDLMQCLQKLWKTLKSDKNLPKKLRDSARHIEWLKTVKESHGSVELSSLSLATTINKKGMYVIQAPSNNRKITPDSVLHLYLEDNLGVEDTRCYSLEELKELLNKLMLMSGKGDQGNIEVEKFSEIFTYVQRLARCFIDLYLAGNMLFRNWKTRIYCSDGIEFGIIMDFNVKSICELAGKDSVTELLPEICRTMENMLEQWISFMDMERSQLYYLNYYTAEQLVYLCQQFQRIDINEKALVMLSFIKSECTKQDPMKALLPSQKVGLKGFSKLSPGSDKTMLNLHLQNCTDVLKKLEMVWEYSMKYISSLFPGCLDINRLGKSLRFLADTEKNIINRTLHPSLLQGRPNLILCPNSEILPCAIAIYMCNLEQSLPSYDEVLLCTPNTTFEEVSLFLRRCLTPGYCGKRVYSLLYADELSYDIGYKSEQLFQQLQAKSDLNYNLVVICNSDREHCYIPSVFSQYKVHVIPQKPLQEIQQYLERHFRNKEPSAFAPAFKNNMSVGIVASKRAGVGKSLYVKRLHQKLMAKLPREKPLLKTIRLIKPQVDEKKVLQMLVPFFSSEYKNKPIIFHIDITSSVIGGISEFLFKLLVLQYLMDSEGIMWKRQPCHLYVIEILESSCAMLKKPTRSVSHVTNRNLMDFFPKISCCTPKEVLVRLTENSTTAYCGDPGMDEEEFRSECFQRPFQYLTRFEQKQNLDTFTYVKESVEGHPARCVQILLMYCGIIDPSWSELRNFAWFLNLQLKDCESSIFCDHTLVGDTLLGFKNFVVNFMIMMAKDFATPSLHIADQSPGRQTFNFDGVKEEDLAPFLMRKKWESEPHPYIFFNDDHVSLTFIGFHLRPNNSGGVDAINPKNDSVIQKNIMSVQLYQGLQLQRVPFNVDFDQLPRDEKISKLCMVLGIQWPFDPDDTYELTMDNMLKILAIKMRFRCGIPVIIMGETGCGKTRLIKYLCKLCKGFVDTENLKLVKVHGGTSAEAIYTKILEAQDIALYNKENQCDTVLFFDEANTTEAISSIKEALCDRTVEGEPLIKDSGLQIIAACNPYRKHTEEMIKRLESAGLGYRVKAEETKERLGSIPLRQLVYRVHALPPSMMPLVWDFGQLDNETEKKYIQQIVQRLANEVGLSNSAVELLTNVLSASQSYMRKRNDECSFVSLRDVERCIEVFKWFYNHNEQLVKNLKDKYSYYARDKSVWSLILAVGVCYHASLENKEPYRKSICNYFPAPYKGEQHTILQEITKVQDLFLSGVILRETIAKNLALKENLFMMVICIELKIPLFLVGKPGSSKSLAKTIVADAMQGQAAHTNLYKDLKQIHLVSFQCSPHSTPEGIIGTFKHCARFQEGKNLNEYVSVVVLDEIGLAEDSPKMPLKTLHPLLEDGSIDDDPLPHKKVGFIGISNWALDPAKMNRGIFVSRGDPNKNELIESARGICSSNKLVLGKLDTFFSDFAQAYKDVCKTQKKQQKEFFGLRDFYSLIKMIFAFTNHSQKEPTMDEIARAVLRNFSGKDELNALALFIKNKEGTKYSEEINTIDLVMENITSYSDDSECRYLLILTKNYAALQILQQAFFKGNQHAEIIFGSSFPKDQEYTQICRNINRIKICMETGQMVILLNLQNLYESLYDALNQYYVYLAGQKYVDLGLGTHRVKCRVHPAFRLIVIEEKEVVYKDFPIPLINRLEKHYMDINTVLTAEQKAIVRELEIWIKNFTTANKEKDKYTPSDVFIGYHSDTCASVVLQVTETFKEDPTFENIMEITKVAKSVLLNCATPDSVIRLGSQDLVDEYFKRQNHNSLMDFVCHHIRSECQHRTVFTEITTFSRLLTSADKKILKEELHEDVDLIEVLSLQQFDTEYAFLKKIRSFLEHSARNKILIVQTDFEEGSQGAHLVASAKYSAVNEINKVNPEQASAFVYFITKLPRIQGGTSYVGFQGGLWKSVHIDDLRKSKDMVSDITALQNLTISQLFCDQVNFIETEVSQARPRESKPSTAKTEEEIEVLEMEIDADDNNVTANVESGVTPANIPDIDMENESENEMETETPERKHVTTVEDVLDTTILIRSCIQNAVGLLRDEENLQSRSTRRIEILINMLITDNDIKASFLKMLKARLYGMLKNQEENLYNAKEWVVREASNPDALQEAGTFRHTLWRHIQVVITPFLAHLLSIVDTDANLEILVDSDSSDIVKALWMFIFSDEKLLNISYILKNSSSRTDTMLVKNYMNLSICQRNSIPFSWRIKDYLEEIWAQAQCIDSAEGPEMKFVSIFSQAPLGKYISTWRDSDCDALLLYYERDFILLTMKISCITELELMVFALSSCIEELRISKPEEQVTLPWVHLGYNKFQHRLQNFSRIAAINPIVLDQLIEKLPELQSTMSRHLVLDIYAAMACLEILQSTVLIPSPQAWLHQVKNLQIPVDLICSENYLQGHSTMCQQIIEEIKTMWNCIFSMALFIEHVVTEESVQNPQMQEILQENTNLLGRCLQEFADIKSQRPFSAVIDVLLKCREDVGKSMLRYGVQMCPVCQEDPQEPVCLPCNHVVCQSCIKQWLQTGRKTCPVCNTELPENFNIVVSERTGDTIQKYAKFRQQCNGFFIDIICTFCFKDNTPPDEDVILQLLSFVFINKECLLNGPRKFTKSLSPFDDSVDKIPVIRSVILKLLLKYSFEDIKIYVQKYLSSVQESHMLSKDDTTEVYMMFVNCLEDSMYEQFQVVQNCDKINYIREQSSFLKHFSKNSKKYAKHESSIEFLQAIARIRLALDTAVEQLDTHEIPDISNYLKNVKDFCTNSANDWYRVYLIRKLANQYGIEHVQKLFEDEDFRWLFPPQIFQKKKSQASQIDLFLVCGNNYKLLRDGIGKALLENKEERISEAQKECKSQDTEQPAHLILAVFREVTMFYATQDYMNPATVASHDPVKTFIQNISTLQEQTTRQFLESLLSNNRPILKVGPQMSSFHYTVIGLAMHFAAVLLNGKNNLLGPLKNLAFSPDRMQNSYLPTMPEDMLAHAKDILHGVRWYVCPNNHYCAIGECGQPMELSRCIDCGAAVGGQNHVAQAGFTIIQQEVDRTQTGHVLGAPERLGSSVAPDRDVPAPAFILLRLLTHLSMILGAEHNPRSLMVILKPQVQDPGRFLLGHIAKDLEHLKNTLGKSADETTTIVHLILRNMLTNTNQQPGQWAVHFDETLSSKLGRNAWEKHMVSSFITPALKSLDKDLLEVNNFISKDERISSNPIVKIVYGDPLINGDPMTLPRESAVQCSKIWSCRKRLSVEYLRHIAQQKDGKDFVPILWNFLEREGELRMVKYLPEILNLQKDLVKRFQNHRDMDKQTITDFLMSIRSDGARHIFERRIKAFLLTWNHLRNSLHVNGEIKLPEGTCDKNITMESDFNMLLPRRQGLGLCATALVNYLIKLHNDFVYLLEKYTDDEQKYSIRASEVMDLHVIGYEVEKDLMPIILSNCQYSVKRGETLEEFDLEKIQRQITSRFLQGKPLITLNGLPTFIHSQDRNYENLFIDVKRRLEQESLTNSAINMISRDLNSYSDVCEALHTVEVTLGFLSMSGGDPEHMLTTYIDNTLQMAGQTSAHILEALKQCHLKHGIALWQLLIALKSEHLLRLKRDPFKEVDKAYKQELNLQGQKLLKLFLEHRGINFFLLELHEMIMLKLKNPQSVDEFKPVWALRDTLGPLLDGKDTPFLELDTDFPEQITLAHCIETWKIAAEIKWKRHGK
ncbi:E3 ubiquitin-protein ligase RNF213 [Bombina bombina]|uniref:E3 ubiquitin-protein ligase RNF213 n=1 Tax=Bombina bombina TaxID=8345 RepID=UPI00235AF2CC|nr:E3 ubiquitin-protein ligase RNF213 [Bombina bombina]